MTLMCELWIEHSEALGIETPEWVLSYVRYLAARFGPDGHQKLDWKPDPT
jgi:hypothetical protein